MTFQIIRPEKEFLRPPTWKGDLVVHADPQNPRVDGVHCGCKTYFAKQSLSDRLFKGARWIYRIIITLDVELGTFQLQIRA
jgi:hypothetical protein